MSREISYNHSACGCIEISSYIDGSMGPHSYESRYSYCLFHTLTRNNCVDIKKLREALDKMEQNIKNNNNNKRKTQI